MHMADSEIRWRYKQSKDKDIIKKLAELNACPTINIVAIINGHKSEILKEKPVIRVPDKRVRKGKPVRISNMERYAEYTRLYNEGMCDKEIGGLTGKTKKTICAWRKRMGLISHVAPKRKPASLNN